jgi:hypothetical protein
MKLILQGIKAQPPETHTTENIRKNSGKTEAITN